MAYYFMTPPFTRLGSFRPTDHLLPQINISPYMKLPSTDIEFFYYYMKLNRPDMAYPYIGLILPIYDKWVADSTYKYITSFDYSLDKVYPTNFDNKLPLKESDAVLFYAIKYDFYPLFIEVLHQFGFSPELRDNLVELLRFELSRNRDIIRYIRHLNYLNIFTRDEIDMFNTQTIPFSILE